jgi:hypothetical protein
VECHVVDGWPTAPIGALVQISPHAKPAIGWRKINQSDSLMIVAADEA